MAYGYTMSGAFDEFPAQALSWSTAGTGSLGGIATTSGWGRVGDTFSVPAGFTRLRVEARVELHNDPVAIFVFGFGTGSITETISLAVIGPDGLFEYGTLTLTDLSFSGVAPPSLPSPPGGSLAASSGLEIPVALEFDIPAVGGDFSVSLGVDTMVSAGGLGGATSVDNGNLTAQVIAFEVEALE